MAKVPLRRSEHINLKEARMRGMLVRSLAKEPASQESRNVLIMDSLVALGSGAKGRSSSRRLNAIQQAVLGEELMAGIYIGGLHVGTKHNPMDAPSRNRPVRKVPATRPPDWLVTFRERASWDDLALQHGDRCIPDVLFPELKEERAHKKTVCPKETPVRF